MASVGLQRHGENNVLFCYVETIILNINYRTRFKVGCQSGVFALLSTEIPMRKVKSA